MKKIEGNIIDIHQREIYPGVITIEKGIIVSIERNSESYSHYIAPGFIDAHVHIESSMISPVEFSKIAISCGTVAIVNDPHEIANVVGVEGIDFMIENSKKGLIKTYFTIPSCVPATPIDSAGSVLSSGDIEKLIKTNKFIGLSEVMNVPGVIYKDSEVIKKIELARNAGLKIDGHAPGLSGDDLKKYINAGIDTDHECSCIEEAKEKISLGMKILIRQGSAAQNYESLKELIKTNPNDVMFCTDDSHLGDLLKEGHIDKIVRKAIKDGFDIFDIFRIASINAIEHYKLRVGTLKPGDSADFIKIENLESLNVLSVYIDGFEKYNKGDSNKWPPVLIPIDREINNFNRKPICKDDLRKEVEDRIICIKITDGEIITKRQDFNYPGYFSNFESDTTKDVLKLVYLNRYQNGMPQIAYITGVGLKRGAFATSISHDSHNIIAVGCKDDDILGAINLLIEHKGGLVVKDGEDIDYLSLPLAGIMSYQDGYEVARAWDRLIDKLKNMGCYLSSPFMTLSFMSLIVIPELKIGEKGLFDYNKFAFISE